MQSENFDKKIREAADQHSTAYHEGAWDKMERLLDKHLPQKRNSRRRYLLFLLFFILLSGSIYVLVSKPFGNGKSVARTETMNANIPNNTVSDDESVVQKRSESETAPVENPNPGNNQESEITLDKVQQEKVQKKLSVPANNDITLTQPQTNKKSVASNTEDKKIRSEPSQKKEADETQHQPSKNETAIDKTTEPLPDKTKPSATEDTNPVKSELKDETVNKTDKVLQKEEAVTETEAPVAEQKPPILKPKKHSGFLSKLAITVSAGPDVSAVALNNIGKTQFVYGAGLSYSVSPKFTLRTGIYAARKIYTAEPKDYDPPSNFWNYYPNLKQIDADCRVLEWPLLVDYNFGSRKHQSWFVSAGVSSVFMKKETYDYLFKPPYAPQYVTYSHTHNNENKHYFSMLSLSGGYTRVINKNISLRAEPYVRIPLKGIGYGKVDLNSGGLLFSAIVKPFTVKTGRK